MWKKWIQWILHSRFLCIIINIGALYYFVEYPSIGFACYIVLPKAADIRYFSGDIRNSKDDAKRSAAYKAVIALRMKGCLIGDLRPKAHTLS